MKLIVSTIRKGTEDAVYGWHISSEPNKLIEEIGSDTNRGYLLVTAINNTNGHAFGKIWDDAHGRTKKIWLASNSKRGSDPVEGLVDAPCGDGSYIKYAARIETVDEYEDSVFDYWVMPDTTATPRHYHTTVRFHHNKTRQEITRDFEQVITTTMPIRQNPAQTPIAAQDLYGDIRFGDLVLQIDASNIFPTFPLEDEIKWHTFELTELPVSTDVFARNFQNYYISGDHRILLRSGATPVTGRRIIADDIDYSVPMALDRANGISIFKYL